MPRIVTPLTKLLNMSMPILSAPMALQSTAQLAVAVTAAGAFGFMGAGFRSSKELKSDFDFVRKQLGTKDGDVVPVGIGFLGWVLDQTETSDDPRISSILEEKPAAICFAFGVELGKYIYQVHAYNEEREHKTKIFVTVNSVADALKAASEWKVDVIIAQGIEAGGHGGSDAPPLLTLLQAILDAIPNGPLVVAAGGVSTGKQIAALLTMGAAGVLLGTRFLFTNECNYPQVRREILLKSGINSTIRSHAFDEVARSNGWPPNVDGRAIYNQIIVDVNDDLSLEERITKFDESVASGDSSRLIVWAGAGVGLTNKITSASDVVHELHHDALEALQSVAMIVA